MVAMVAALQAASYRLLADALAMITAIVAIFNSKRASNFNFSYGFERLQTLLWFANAVLMLFVSLFIFEGVVETLLLGGEIEPRYVWLSDGLCCWVCCRLCVWGGVGCIGLVTRRRSECDSSWGRLGGE